MIRLVECFVLTLIIVGVMLVAGTLAWISLFIGIGLCIARYIFERTLKKA